MSLAIVTTGRSTKKWVEVMLTHAPEIKLQIYPDIFAPEEVSGVLCWKHPHGSLKLFPNLKWITSLGAGVDHILDDPDLPDVPITRIVDPNLALDISRMALMGVIGFEKHMPLYIRQKRVGVWAQHFNTRLQNIGVLGLGEMGSRIANDLRNYGYNVFGFSRTPKDIEGVKTFSGDSVPEEFLCELDVLINVLPLTPATENILDCKLFSRMKKGSFMINLGRGKHLNEEDLLKAIHDNLIGGAFLDVFRSEPLPGDHPFWQEDNIVVTPHIASITKPESAVKLILENYNRMKKREPLLYEVDKKLGY